MSLTYPQPPRADDLAAAWRRLDANALLGLIEHRLGWSGWKVIGNRVEGPCPVQGGPKCGADRRAAFVYASQNGWPPWIHCHHRSSCGFARPLLEALADRLGSKAEAVAVVKRLGLGTVPRAVWPVTAPLILPSTPPPAHAPGLDLEEQALLELVYRPGPRDGGLPPEAFEFP